jgi:hypothetical protein
VSLVGRIRLSLIVLYCVVLANGAEAKNSESEGPHVNARGVDACLTLTLGALEYYRNVALVRATLTLRQQLLSCGCVSHGLRYFAVLAEADGSETMLSFGEIQTFKRLSGPAAVLLVAASDEADRIDFSKVTLNLTCL